MSQKDEFHGYRAFTNDSTAAAILVLADRVERVATQLKNLGTGNAATDMGAIEALAMKVSEAGNEIAVALGNITV